MHNIIFDDPTINLLIGYKFNSMDVGSPPVPLLKVAVEIAKSIPSLSDFVILFVRIGKDWTNEMNKS